MNFPFLIWVTGQIVLNDVRATSGSGVIHIKVKSTVGIANVVSNIGNNIRTLQ